jgi:amino-acid N-acetyltransferase
VSLTFRTAATDDLYAVVTLLRARDLPVDGFGDLLRSHPENVVVAELNRAIVGSAALDVHDTDALLRSVAVATDLATLGVGTRLVTEALARARVAGVTDVYLLTTTADQWFPRFGFAVADRASIPESIASTVEFTAACPSSAIAMRCAL